MKRELSGNRYWTLCLLAAIVLAGFARAMAEAGHPAAPTGAAVLHEPDTPQPQGYTDSCVNCHGDIENAMQFMGAPGPSYCIVCHGGDPSQPTKEKAHVQPTQPVIMDNTVAPLDYDLPYQQFVNPSNLRVVANTCAHCHWQQAQVVLKGLMATTAGHYAGGLYQNGVVDTKTPIYATFAITDTDGDVPTEHGAVESLQDLIFYDPAGDPDLVATHYRAVPSQACARCHLWSRGKGYRGAVGAEGVYRADGCAACHMVYEDDGLSQSADANIDHTQSGHPMIHVITKAIPTQQCLHCHHRGARIGLSYTGRAQMPPRLPSGPGVPGTTDKVFNGNYHMTDALSNPPDIHHAQGMHCIDCHTKGGVMGDGNMYGHMDQATKIRCATCHGTPTDAASLIDADGLALNNVRTEPDGTFVLTSKVTGQEHLVKQAKDVVDPNEAIYNPRAACAMDENHLKPDGGLECYACHSAWTPNCFGCHFERDERQMGLNLITRELEVGRARTNNKVFESLKTFFMGPNRKGKTSPYVVGCQPIADVTAPDGSKILDMVMPWTVNDLSGLALDPVNPHTVRTVGEVRGCAECHRAPPSLGLGSGNYALARDYVLAATAKGVGIFDRKTSPSQPAPVDTLALTAPMAFAAKPNIIEGSADWLYVAAGTSGLLIYDLRGEIPVAPAVVLSDVDAIEVSRAGDYLYVVVRDQGIRIYENSDPLVANLASSLTIPTALKAIPWGIHLFVAAGPAGLVVADISDHAAPAIVGSVPGVNAVDVAPYAHYQNGSAFAARAYVADPDFGVWFVSLLPNLSYPTLVGGAPLPGAIGLDTYTRYLSASDSTPSREHDYLYVAAGASGLRVLDITDPDAVEATSMLADLGGHVVDVDVASDMNPPGTDDYAFLANDAMGLQVIDVSDPRQPALVGTVPATAARRVFVEVQPMDRFIDEQGHELKENSHPGVEVLSRADIVRILSAEIITECALPGDFDFDQDVDRIDFVVFQSCIEGPGGTVPPPCVLADFDHDGDVDLEDMGHFQVAFTGL